VPGAAALTGWTGRPSDLKIKRINLSSLFVHLLLASYGSTGVCKCSVTGAAYPGATVVPALTMDGYYLKKSILLLYNSDQTIDSKQVLAKDVSFVYDQNVWRGSLDANLVVDRLDLRSTVTDFLQTFLNPNAAAGSSPSALVQAMINYMNAYNDWAASSFNNSLLKSNASSAQVQMMSVLQGLYSFPANPPVEVACP
jgi:hypothetical protein